MKVRRASRKAQGERRMFVITGLSGAGKSQALKIFEDLGYFCVDNLPVALMGSFAQGILGARQPRRVALGLDIRGGDFLMGLSALREDLHKRGYDCRILFLEATERSLVRRFSETRHRHPLGRDVLNAIREERRLLTEIKGLADKIIDTSAMTLGELKEKISQAMGAQQAEEMVLSVVSFGYKHGIPLDADLVMDVRFLPNPNYHPKFRRKSGLDRPVQTFIMRQAVADSFLKQFSKMVRSLLPHYIREGKSYLTLAIGCTGGRHRSVFVAHYLTRMLRTEGYKAREYHRDLDR
ncbi:RNase adapter RapZ [Elusimicrobiota bacterium]